MATTQARPRTAAKKSLPPIKVAKFREISRLLEGQLEKNTDGMIAAGDRFRAQHRKGTQRPLSAMEVAQVAAGFDKSLAEAKRQVDEAGLTAYDEPDPLALLLAAGLATASEWFDGMLEIVALIEMDDDRFRAATEAQALSAAVATDAERLGELDLPVARDRARRAMEHLAAQSGVDPGKAWGLLGRSAWQALNQAAEHLRTIPSMSSLTPSPASTDGPEP